MKLFGNRPSGEHGQSRTGENEPGTVSRMSIEKVTTELNDYAQKNNGRNPIKRNGTVLTQIRSEGRATTRQIREINEELNEAGIKERFNF